MTEAKGECVFVSSVSAPSEVELGKVRALRSLIEPKIAADRELQEWCTDACLLRFLRSRSMDVEKAAHKLEKTLEWRQSYKPHKIRWEDIREEAKTGKNFVMNHPDKEGRTVILLRPRCENSKNAIGQIKVLVYSLEYASRIADERGVEKMTWLIGKLLSSNTANIFRDQECQNFEGYSMRNAPSPKVGIQTLSILQGHYPERLGLAVCYHPPTLFSLTWKVCSPLIDPITYQKIHFCESGPKGEAVMERFFDLNYIEECMGGKSPPQFNLEAYEKQRLAVEAAKDNPAANGSGARLALSS